MASLLLAFTLPIRRYGWYGRSLSTRRALPGEHALMPLVGRCTVRSVPMRLRVQTACRPGQASIVLTKHYENAHPEILGVD